MAQTTFPTNPEFAFAERIGLAPIDLEVPSSVRLHSIANDIFRICHLISALRTLQLPDNGNFLDENAAQSLRLEIAWSLDRCAVNSPDAALKDLFHRRALDFTENKYLQGPQLQAEANEPFLELMLGPIPSWRFPKHPRLFGCIFAVRSMEERSLIDWESDVAESLASHLFSTINIVVPQPSPFPALAICDLLVAGGELLGHPLHIANFLPSDEGVFHSTITKTIIYRNLYLQRYSTVTTELGAYALSRIEHLPQGVDAWNHLIAWFRGHDIGHCYLDSQIQKATHLDRYQRYILQELVADVFGLLFSLQGMAQQRTSCSDRCHQVTLFLTEALRYALRDPELFPDAAASRIQLSYCIHSGSLRHSEAGQLDIAPERVIQDLEALLSDVVVAARSSNVAYITLLMNRHLRDSNIDSALSKLRPPVPCTDVYPRFKTADTLFASDLPKHTRTPTLANLTADEARRGCRRD